MRKAALLAGLGLLAFPNLYVTPVQAADVVYVDPNNGLDTNTCTQNSQCLTVGHALTLTPGTIVIAPGVLGPTSITQQVTITCPMGPCLFDNSTNNASAGDSGITINAPGASISLQGLSVSAFGTQSSPSIGISVTNVAKLEIKNVSISGEPIDLDFAPSTASTNSHLYVTGGEIRNASVRNVAVAPTSSNSATAVFTDVKMHHGNAGFLADATAGTGGVSVVINDSVISFQNNNSVIANGNASGGAVARILINNSVISHSALNCVSAINATATIALSKTMVTQCNTALFNSGGGIFTYGDNAINFNTSNGSTPTTAGGFR